MIALFSVEALRTLTASPFTLLCARLFGRKFTGHDGRCVVTLSAWRGKTYLIGFVEEAQREGE